MEKIKTYPEMKGRDALSGQRLFPFFLFFLLVMSSCTQQPRLSELKIQKATLRVTCKGEDFSGDAWSSDGKTLCLKCENGKIISLTAYHENGEKAIESKNLFEGGQCYDERGGHMTMDAFIKRYPVLMERIAAATYEFKDF